MKLDVMHSRVEGQSNNLPLSLQFAGFEFIWLTWCKS